MATTDGPTASPSEPLGDPQPAEPAVPPDVPAAPADTGLAGTKAAATWTGLVIGVLVLILLLVFILQNLDQVALQLFFWEFSLPLGVSLLLAAIAGALIMALAGGVRILQIRRVAKKARSTTH
ncbi:lipopolysaccharide assembly protein LapA domain-containing protein [Rhodococcus oryzae]|uniref:lipopolysaccharide assembly protein LapA domain-containing protein n=1 Tax=Rhodococcus oryzae TaxID=2571143 RepID=UPI0037B0F595